jgi:hypothetical protein
MVGHERRYRSDGAHPLRLAMLLPRIPRRAPTSLLLCFPRRATHPMLLDPRPCPSRATPAPLAPRFARAPAPSSARPQTGQPSGWPRVLGCAPGQPCRATPGLARMAAAARATARPLPSSFSTATAHPDPAVQCSARPLVCQGFVESACCIRMFQAF